MWGYLKGLFLQTHGCLKGLVIATPFYEVKAYSPYIVSLVDAINVLHEMQLPFDYYEISGDSYVDRAKNSLVNRFLKSEHSHIMMVDSDEAWNPEGFCKMLKSAMLGAEIIGAAYPCKNNWEFFGCIPNKTDDGYFVGVEIEDDIRLMDMWCIPGGFIIYSRDAFERTRSNLDTYVDPESGEEFLECFKCNIEPHDIKNEKQLAAMNKKDLVKSVLKMQKGLRGQGGRIGEDVYFQKRFKEMGGRVLLEPDVTIQHFGIKAWEGNYLNFLLKKKEQFEKEQSLGETQEDTIGMLKAL